MRDLKELTRPNVWNLSPYSSARDEYSGHDAHVFLDANENPYNNPLNRYPDPLQHELKALLARRKQVREDQIFLGNGSDEAIDLLYRCFTQPGIDNVVAIEPTYGMYKVCADINEVEYRPVLLDQYFQMSSQKMLDACDRYTKIIWICSPNNPTGNLINENEIIRVLEEFDGLVVVDEAYSDFSQHRTMRSQLDDYPNLIVLNTMSKAWGCAGIRLGMAFTQPDIIKIMNKVKYPYNINVMTQQKAIEILNTPILVEEWVRTLLLERERMIAAFNLLPICKKIYPTNANFFLARVSDAQAIYDYLVGKGIIVRNRNRVRLCADCLRITIGTKTENSQLLSALRQY